jgi:hypothetical protein
VFSYLFLSLAWAKVTVVIIVIVFSAADFWIVKNVTGRLLVGFRWWTEIDEENDEVWRFESHDHEQSLHPIDKHIFWWSQIIATGFWAVIFVFDVISFSFLWVSPSSAGDINVA